jgi:hypothetical protein
MRGYSLERVIEVWNDDDGCHWEIGNDGDVLGLVEIKEFDENNKIQGRLTFERECAVKIMQALSEYVQNDDNFEP